MNWHDENAHRLQGEADRMAAHGGAGSIEHWNLINGAQMNRQEARWQDAANAPPAIASFTPLNNSVYSTGAGAWASSAGGGSSGWLARGLARAMLISAAAIVALVAAGWGAEAHWEEGRRGGGLGRFAAAFAFHGESLSPASRYASAPDPGVHPAGGPPRLTGAQAYACQLDAKCAESPKANMLHAASMLAAATKAGDETAARDLCLMPLLTGSGSDSVETARFYCAAALRNGPASAEARRIGASLSSSPVIWAARMAQRVQSWATAP